MIIHVALLIAGAAVGADDAPPLKLYEQTQVHMGTEFKISLHATSESAADEAFRAAFARIEELNNIMSDYDPNSELSRLSDSAPPLGSNEPGPAVRISDDLRHVLDRAATFSEMSDGAFDVTVGPLSKLWRRARRQQEFPPAERLQEARDATGYEYLRLDSCARTAQLLRPAMRLDLGGIAKGYAADEALRELQVRGIRRAAVNGGGDLAIGDPPPGETGWKIGIAPLNPDAPPSRFLRLANCGIATSGDAWQYVEIDGARYSHILDPQTGLGLTQRSGVSILAPNCTTADALASTVSVLGPKQGLALVERVEGAAAMIVVDDDGQTRTYQSNRFNAYDRTR